MTEKIKCPACLEERSFTFLGYGVIAPWISELSKNPYRKTTLVRCMNCALTFFTHRFNSNEIAAIYSDYRGNGYFKARNKWEPWYGKKENDLYLLFRQENRVEARKQNMRKNLERSNIKLESNLSVLDFGGDQGQFFPEEASQRTLFEYSNSDTKSTNIMSNNVRKISNLSEIEGQDLAMLCGVLEHLTDPLGELMSIEKALKVGTGIMYVEVPMDCPKVSRFHKTIYYSKYLDVILYIAQRFPKAFVILDFISGVFRNFNIAIPPFGIIKQSEHINYFTIISLRNLMGVYFQVENLYEDPKKKHGKFRLGEIAAVCRS